MIKINHLLCARLATNLTLFVFTLFILGVVLSTADLFLDWDILPDGIQRYAELAIVIFGIVASLLVVSSFLCSLMVLAEFAAKRVGIQGKELRFNRKKSTILLVAIISILIAFLALQTIDEYREENRLAKNRIEFQEKLDKQSKALAESLSQMVTLFPSSLLQAIENKQVFKIKPKYEEDELIKFLNAISVSLPQQPGIALLIPATPPYKYGKISFMSDNKYGYDPYKTEGQQFFIQFPNEVEKEIVETLFQGKTQMLKASLKGNFIDNSEPSAWGILKFNDKIVALIFLIQHIEGYGRVRDEIFHSGPEILISN
jgi:hypothetical protein